ncbi:MAG: 3-isopropylmalate/3-methylmalate dehydrogenase [Methanobacterium sp. PtaU1.Bin097]|jgi:isopropylmalate/isohomocitrate dehydrogenase-like protein|nr:MAG: 3-isopropylmalate/3-methylmalate dehydrogenase [Methanobacterium sp. PtaU1.Bin097]
MYDIAVIPGDGIGPEVMEVTLELLNILDVSLNFTEAHAGCECYDRTGTTIPEETIQIARQADATLFGAVTTVPGQRSGILALRKALDLYANVRPVKSYPGVPSVYGDLNMVIIRENTEGLYSGMEEETPEGATALRVITEQAAERICKFAFDYAKITGRGKVTAVHKANVLKKTDGIFKDTFYNVARNYQGIELDDRYVDATAMFLITKPHMFDVIVTTNLFGDILSDEGAGLVGGLGLAPSANIGEKNGLFEPVHGSGPDIAGQGISNPSAMILSAVMMLNYLKENGEAQRLEKALSEVLNEAKRLTPDLGGNSKTADMAREIKGKLH